MPDICHFCQLPKKPLYRHRATKLIACQPCYRKHLKPKYPCLLCGQVRSAGKWVVRDGQKHPVCETCYRKRFLKDQCKYCHHHRRIAMRDDEGQAVCDRCYQKFEKLEPCTRCGRQKKVVRRIDGKPYCNACHKLQRVGQCHGCQSERVIFNTFEGHPYCRPCYRRVNVQPCAECQRPKTIYARGLCTQCYFHDREAATLQKIASMTRGLVIYHAATHEFATVRSVRVPKTIRGRTRPLRAVVQVDVRSRPYEENGTLWPISQCRLIQRKVYAHSANTTS